MQLVFQVKAKTELLLSAEASKAAQRADLQNHLDTAQHALQDKQQVMSNIKQKVSILPDKLVKNLRIVCLQTMHANMHLEIIIYGILTTCYVFSSFCCSLDQIDVFCSVKNLRRNPLLAVGLWFRI